MFILLSLLLTLALALSLFFLPRITAFALYGAAALFCLSGCALPFLASQSEKAAKAGGKLVTLYCTNINDESIRTQIRDGVNRYAYPNSVRVTCAAYPNQPLQTGREP